MLMKYLTALLVFFPLSSLAKPSPCYKLLTSNSKAEEFTAQDLSSAQAWMAHLGLEGSYPPQLLRQAGFQNYLARAKVDWSKLNEDQKSDRAAGFLVTQWQSWSHINKQQRDFALAFDLRKLSPKIKREDNVVDMNAGPNREDLSHENLERMLARLAETYPLTKPSSLEDNRVANKMASELVISFMRPFKVELGASAGPVMSPRELKPLGLEFNPDFYSLLVDTSATVSFEAVVTHAKHDSPSEIGSYLMNEGILLNSPLVLKQGFVIPRFATVNQLMDFFDFWDPAADLELFRSNWLALPKSITTYPAFRSYLTAENIDEIFPKSGYYDQLAPLRTRLNNYVLTVSDASILLNRAFRHWILYLAEKDPEALTKVRRLWALDGNATNLFRRMFLPFLQIPSGLSLQVPVGVLPSQYSIIHNNASVTRFERRWNLSEPIYDSRRIDHDSKP